MDFLRRLHPRHAARADAAVPDLGAWRVAALPLASVGQAAVATGPVPSELPVASPRSPADADAANRSRPVADMAPLRPVARQASSPAPSNTPDSVRPAPADARVSTRPARVPARRTQAAVTDDPYEAPRLRSPAATVAAPVVTASRPAPKSSPPSPQAPLTSVLSAGTRALQWLADRPAAAPERPVVHVSIDRIDVRIPPAPAVTPRKPRAVSNVGTLSEYLRGHGRDSP